MGGDFCVVIYDGGGKALYRTVGMTKRRATAWAAACNRRVASHSAAVRKLCEVKVLPYVRSLA